MYTYDEWGNIVLHIQTGVAGMKALKEAGLTSTHMDEDSYKKHMESYYRIQQERSDALYNEVYKMLNISK